MCIQELPDPRRRDEQVMRVTNRVLRGLVQKCVQTDPERRPTMQTIIDELKDFNAAQSFYFRYYFVPFSVNYNKSSISKRVKKPCCTIYKHPLENYLLGNVCKLAPSTPVRFGLKTEMYFFRFGQPSTRVR